MTERSDPDPTIAKKRKVAQKMDKDQREQTEYVIDREYDYARRILKHYYNLLREEVGRPYDSDCDAEIEACIDSIKEAVKWQINLALAEHGIEEKKGE